MDRNSPTKIRGGVGAARHIKSASTARTEDAESLDRRTEIRNKARDIFVRYGYRKTTIEDIGKACGLGKAALYHYYSSKEEIFAAMVHAESERILAQVRAAVGAAGDPRAKLAAMIRTRFKIIGDVLGEFIGNEHGSEITDVLPLAANAWHRHCEEEIDILRKILEEGHRRGVFRKVKLPSVPILMIAAIRGIDLHFAEAQDAPSLEEGLESMLDLFFDGICR
jgi:AcrR family transcriptional regulator